ncbi:MAG: MarR family winged helix-turn-helix transcriptional regulator [Thermoleophilaceae bacterium]
MAQDTATETDLATRLRLAVTRTARRLRQEAGSDMSPSLSAALATVERHGPLTPSELAKIEAVKRPTATRIVAKLAGAGLVDRAGDPTDGRVSLVSITAAGSALLSQMRSRKNAYLASRLDELESDDVAALERAAQVLEGLLEGGRR